VYAPHFRLQKKQWKYRAGVHDPFRLKIRNQKRSRMTDTEKPPARSGPPQSPTAENMGRKQASAATIEAISRSPPASRAVDKTTERDTHGEVHTAVEGGATELGVLRVVVGGSVPSGLGVVRDGGLAPVCGRVVAAGRGRVVAVGGVRGVTAAACDGRLGCGRQHSRGRLHTAACEIRIF
jgi:hypothetical protein